MRERLPWPWLSAAAALHPRGLHVALGIWMTVGSARPGASAVVHLANIASTFRFHPSQAGRALLALVDAGLVTVERRLYNQPVVTICAVPSAKGARGRPRAA